MSNTLKMYFIISLLFSTIFFGQDFSVNDMDEILYGVSYYYEYMPYERLEKDVQLMKESGINFIRICESTWGYHEREEGKFHFEHVDKILDAMYENGIDVIIGTFCIYHKHYLLHNDKDFDPIEKHLKLKTIKI